MHNKLLTGGALHSGNTLWKKMMTHSSVIARSYFDPNNQRRTKLGCAAWLRWSLWGRRDDEPAANCDSGGGVLRNGRSREWGRRLACWLRFDRHRERRRGASRTPPDTTSRRRRRARGRT